MTTNAQAALQAAATQFGGTAATASPATVMGVAAQYRRWLDRTDAMAEEANRKAAETSITGQFSRGGVEPQAVHRLSENHNADPMCTCGWDPVQQYPSIGTHPEARNAIRSHIVEMSVRKD